LAGLGAFDNKRYFVTGVNEREVFQIDFGACLCTMTILKILEAKAAKVVQGVGYIFLTNLNLICNFW
jgi:hypothetical protein